MFPVFYDRSREILHELASSSVVQKYLETLEQHHPGSRLHSHRTSLLSIDMAISLGLPEERVKRVGMVGFLHDVGKESVPHYILEKEGKLTDEEWSTIRAHPRIGFNMLRNQPDPLYQVPFEICQGVIAVHEWQSKPYPRSGKDRRRIPRPGSKERRRSYPAITEESQIAAAADTFDALTSDRGYRKALSYEKVRQIMYEDYTGQPRILHEVLRHGGNGRLRSNTGEYIKLVN